MPVSRYKSQGLREVPEYLKGTIFERANLLDTEPYRVSGYGLVAGLRGTGDNSAIPQEVRKYMVKEILRGGFQSHATGLQDISPEQILRDPRFAVVRVDGLIPPGARKFDPTPGIYNDRFDIYVSAMEESYTKSLSHGTLYTTSLRRMGANPNNPGGSVNVLAMAVGPVFVNPTHALTSARNIDATAQSSLRYGVVMDGGVSRVDNALILVARDPQYSTTRLLERRINERFQNEADKTNAVGRLAMASAVDDAVVRVYVPRSYAGDWQHFAGIVKHLYVKGDPGYLAQMAQRLADAAVQPDAPLENISYALEGIGTPAESVLRKLMHYPQQDVAYAAARAAAFVFDDEEEPRDVLVKMAKTVDHPFRLNAVRTLGKMRKSPETNQAVRQLVESDNNMVRIEAYKALVRGQDPRVFTQVVREKFALDLITSSGSPLLYASRRGIPRIAIFNTRQALVSPVLYSAFDSRLTLTAEQAGGPVTVYYRAEAAVGDPKTETVKQRSPVDLPELLGRLGGEAAEDEKRLDFSYAEVVALLQSLHQSGKLVGYTLDGAEVPITLVIEEEPSAVADTILSAPRIPETQRLDDENPEMSAPEIPDTEAPAPQAPAPGALESPQAQPPRKGRQN